MELKQRIGIFFSLLLPLYFDNVVGDCTAPGGQCCNVCANGGEILNKGHNFVMRDSLTGEEYAWNCGFLELALGDVNVGSTGAAGEARYCGLAQRWAGLECQCSGEPLPEPPAYEANPSCDLCGEVDGQRPPLNYVPFAKDKKLVETGIAGPMPCGGLYYALSDGKVLSANLCPIVQRNVGSKCCSVDGLEAFDFDDLPGAASVEESEEECIAPGLNCESDPSGCCIGFVCKKRTLGDSTRTCSSPSGGTGRDKYSTGRNGRGGAGGKLLRGLTAN